MKLSKSDLLILSNFASINESIHIYEGAMQSTVANSGNLFAFASFDEEFPKEFCIFDLNHFISVYSLVSSTGDTVLEFPKDENYLVIKSEKTSQDIRFCDAKLVEELNRDRKYVIENPDIVFTLSESMLEYGKKSAAINGFTNLVFEGDETEIYMVAETITPNSNNLSERHRRKIEQPNASKRSFTAVFEVSKLKMLSDDYEVRIIEKGGAQFTSKNRDYKIFVALQQPVTFD